MILTFTTEWHWDDPDYINSDVNAYPVCSINWLVRKGLIFLPYVKVYFNCTMYSQFTSYKFHWSINWLVWELLVSLSSINTILLILCFCVERSEIFEIMAEETNSKAPLCGYLPRRLILEIGFWVRLKGDGTDNSCQEQRRKCNVFARLVIPSVYASSCVKKNLSTETYILHWLSITRNGHLEQCSLEVTF